MNTTKAMEEVWKDINLASLNEQNTRSSITTDSTFGGVILQDFLSIDQSSNTYSNTSSLYSPAPPTPLTALTLSSSPNTVSKVSSSTTTPFQSLLCNSSLPSLENKSFAEPTGFNHGERRNKRMIKNRESAARSRARKQAYTKELQLKVDQLLKENAILKRQQQQLYETAASQQKKNTLYRTSSAPY